MTNAAAPPPGPATDARGLSAKDPSENVRDLVTESLKRQDDLREKDAAHVREILKLRTDRNDDLRKQESKHLREISRIRTDYIEKLSLAESARIDAIRAVDVAAVAVANTAAENRATTLAGQVNAAKDAQGVALKAETDPIRKDIGDLRQSQWTIAGGREQVVETREKSSNWGLWAGIAVAAFIGLNTLLLMVSGIVVTVILTNR